MATSGSSSTGRSTTNEGYTGYLGPQRHAVDDGHPINVVKDVMQLTERDIQCLDSVDFINWYLGQITLLGKDREMHRLTDEEHAQFNRLKEQRVAAEALMLMNEWNNSMIVHD